MKEEIRNLIGQKKIIWVLCIAFLKEVCYWIWLEQKPVQTILKLAVAVLIFTICYGWKNRPATLQGKMILTAFGVFIAADLAITWQFLAGGALFLIGHLILVICFWICRKPSRTKILVWLVLTAAEAVPVILLIHQHNYSILIGCLAALYGSVLILMAVCAAGQENRIITAGAYLFLASDLLLALHKVSASLQWLHAPSILLFYLSLGMFLLGCSKVHVVKGDCSD